MIRAAVQASVQQQDQQYRNQLAGMQERFDVLNKKLTFSYASLASSEIGAGQ
jgi:hypothetical protein